MNNNPLQRITIYVMGALALLLVLWIAFGKKHTNTPDSSDATTATELAELSEPAESAEPLSDSDNPEPTDSSETAEPSSTTSEIPEEEIKISSADILAILSPNDTIRHTNKHEAHYDSMPPGGHRIHINSVGACHRVFNDSNYLHIAVASKIGIKPINNLTDAWKAGASLVRLKSCEAYYLDHLSHSLPYLVPKADKLLTDIGIAFRDSLKARGGGDYRIKVTSVLRTPALVKHLRRRNRNAVDTSAHLYGTTFDISYAKFICNNPAVPTTQEDMKNLLAEVVFAMREKGRCYVKYEYKQACFHITAR
jgi:hypothetical protein